MASNEEKQELVEALKGPHFYRLMINGYGAECSYMYISEEAFNFWSKVVEEDGDADAVHYILGADERKPSEVAEDEDYEYIKGSDIPREAMFMHDSDDEVGCTWYEPLDEFEHTWGASADAAYITVDKVDSGEYNAKHVDEVVSHEDFYEWANRISEESDYEVEPYIEEHEYGDRYPEKDRYVCQVMSSEKGNFFDGRIETPTLFDEKKLKFAVAEAPNGEDMIWAVEYDGEEIDNDGGDTNGKGYYVYFYKQEF